MERIKILVHIPPRVAMVAGKTVWGTVEYQPTNEQLEQLTVAERETLYRHRLRRNVHDEIPLRIDSPTVEWDAIVRALRAEIEEKQRRVHEEQTQDTRRKQVLPSVAEQLRAVTPSLAGIPDDEQLLTAAMRHWSDQVAKAIGVAPEKVRVVRIGSDDWKRLKLVRRKLYAPTTGEELLRYSDKACAILPECIVLESYIARVVTRGLGAIGSRLPYTACALVLATDLGEETVVLVRSDMHDVPDGHNET